MEAKTKAHQLEKYLPLVTPVASLLLALIISLFIVYYTIPDISLGESASLFFSSLFDANFKNTRAISNFLVNSTPLMFTGLAHALAFPRASVKRWVCYGSRVETRGRVVAISGDTVDCAGLRRLAQA